MYNQVFPLNHFFKQKCPKFTGCCFQKVNFASGFLRFLWKLIEDVWVLECQSDKTCYLNTSNEPLGSVMVVYTLCTSSFCHSFPAEPPPSPVHPLHPSLCSDTAPPVVRRPGSRQSLQHTAAEARGWSAWLWCSGPCTESTPGRPAAAHCLQRGEVSIMASVTLQRELMPSLTFRAFSH